MFRIRPITLKDLDDLERFSLSTALGMISLPRDRKLLRKVIQHSIESFGSDIKSPKDEIYLFVLENVKTKKIGGSCGIYSKSGVKQPYHFYRVDTIQNIRMLTPVKHSNGPSEVCALYLSPDLRKFGLGRLLSLSRLLFIAVEPKRFDSMVVARLRGVIRKRKKSSPFWDSLGQRLLNIDLSQAISYLEKEKTFLPDYLLKHPIFVPLLTKEAQKVIGQPHYTTQPALEMLGKEGFTLTNEIDLLDAGPKMEAVTQQIKTVQNSVVTSVKEISSKQIKGDQYIISNNKLDFRACLGRMKITPNRKVIIPHDVAEALKLKPGDLIRYV